MCIARYLCVCVCVCVCVSVSVHVCRLISFLFLLFFVLFLASLCQVYLHAIKLTKLFLRYDLYLMAVFSFFYFSFLLLILREL